MEIVNFNWKPLPIPQIEIPRKVIRFESIEINYIDNNVIAFLRRFGPIFAACKINLAIDTSNIGTSSDRILDFILHSIWPMLGKNIHGLRLSSRSFRRLRKSVPSILSDCPSLRFVSFYYGGFFTEFPADDNANASNGQTLAKWLFTALPNNVPKMYKCSLYIDYDENWSFKIAAFKAAFANASSSANFIVVIWFRLSFAHFVVPFDLTNELTREQLALKRINSDRFLLIRCPIARDENKWTKWEEEAIGWEINDQRNRIYIDIYREDQIGDGLLDEIPGSSDQQK